MGYKDRPEEEYVGTGWLIKPDLIATAGRCVYDPSAKFLSYVKVYFGCDGSANPKLSRYGTEVILPAEYLGAESNTHDVGFVRR